MKKILFKKIVAKAPQKLYDFLILPFDNLKSWLFKIKKNKINELTTLNIITGANSSHYRSAIQLLSSISKFESIKYTYFYDLGLTSEERNNLQYLFPDLNIRLFNYEKYPSFFKIDINQGEYAWKPTILKEISKELNSQFVWMDAGNLLKEPLFKMRYILNKYGFYSPKSPGLVIEWTHPTSISSILHHSKNLYKSNLTGGAVAFDTRNEKAMALLSEWSELALQKEMFAPTGSNKKNHRQDQAILTLLAYNHKILKGVPHRLLGFSIHNDID
ncbi:DUF1647 domain-containing protein [Pedobacter sp.]|uniref:DUF1647 domain-containing protein n=1 Tax=Pedobacter sp. TaxID=1411316 RepID=UPI003BAAB566